MEKIKCPECGAEFSSNMTACPSCGCPTTEVQTSFSETVIPAVGSTSAPISITEKTAVKDKHFLINFTSILALILGIIIVFMGMKVMNQKAKIDTYKAKSYSADAAVFGADFYTEIYGASDKIVDELNDINGGIESLSNSIADMANIIYYPIGMLIVAIGLGVIASSFNHIIKRQNSQS